MLTKDDFIVSSLGKCSIPSPVTGQAFVRDDESVTYFMDPTEITAYTSRGEAVPAFERAGAREKNKKTHIINKCGALLTQKTRGL